MRRLILLGAVLGAIAVGLQAQTDEELLKRADSARFIEAPSYLFTSKVASERPDGKGGTTRSEALLKIFNKRFPEGYRVRIEFLLPESMKGSVYLIVGDDIYFWQPGLLKPIKLSGQQKLFGDASIAEAAGIRFSGNYAIKSKQEEKLDGRDTIKLALEATSEKVAFAKVTLWLDKKELKPLQAILHALSDEPLKKVIYPKYEKFKDDEYAAEIIIEDLLFKGKTTITVGEIGVQELPDDLFDPEKLGK